MVYKRRIPLPEREAMEWVTGERHCSPDTQITGEVDYFLQYYRGLRPAVFLSYERECARCKLCFRGYQKCRILVSPYFLCYNPRHQNGYQQSVFADSKSMIRRRVC